LRQSTAHCAPLTAHCPLRTASAYSPALAVHYMRATSNTSATNVSKWTISIDGHRVAVGSSKEINTSMKNFGKGISGALLSLAFVFGIVTATSGSAQAQDRNDDRYYQRGNSDRDRKERKREWKRRQKQARRDDRAGNNQGDWRRERHRNNGRYGNNDQYGNRGYGNGGYGNGQDQNEVNRGYQQGVQTGASDGQRNQSYDPQRSRYFKNASSQAYRQGFVQGYNQGFQQYSHNGNQRNGSSDYGLGGILGGILGRP
jgi:hypothetical protein